MTTFAKPTCALIVVLVLCMAPVGLGLAQSDDVDRGLNLRPVEAYLEGTGYFTVSDLDLVLESSQRAAQELNPEALEAFAAAVHYMDRVCYDLVLGELERSQELAPDNVPIRFITAKVALFESRKKTGQDAIALLHISEGACEEILALDGKGAKPSEVRKARSDLKVVQRLIAKQGELDAQGERIGAELRRRHHKRLYPEEYIVEKEDEEEEEEDED